MSADKELISSRKKAALAVIEMAKTDPEIGSLMPDESVREKILKPGQTLLGAFETIFETYADRPALGSRDYTIVHDKDSGQDLRHYHQQFTTISYAQLQARIKALSNAWAHHPQHAVDVDEMICIMGFTGADFVTLDYACAYAQTVSVPLQSATAGADLSDIFRTVEPAALASSIGDLAICTQLAIDNGNIRSLVVFDYDPSDSSEAALVETARLALDQSSVATKLISIDELICFGQSLDWQARPTSTEGGERMAAIIHSSGSTGTPKGAMVSENAIKATWAALPRALPVVLVHIAPLNHLLGRGSLSATLRVGGTAYFTLKADMSTLFEDIRLVRPCYMVFFPRVLELIYQHYQSEVARRTHSAEGSPELVDKLVRDEMGNGYLGDRLKSALVAGAPTSASVSRFIQDCFDLLLINMYGNTESGSGNITVNGVIQRPPVIDYKLRDVPELGYYTTDKPYPRGEFCFKSVVGITGYYKQPELSKDLFDEDGYSLSGDVVEERAHDHIVIIDRVKDVLKLSQGEYVAVGTLGTRFEAGSAVIKQIYIYGNSLRSYLLAVIVPDQDAITAVLGTDYSQAELKNLIRDEFSSVAHKEDIKSFEVPRDFIIETEAFSQDNGLLSSVRKRLRPALKRKYGDLLENIYTQQEQSQEAEVEQLKNPSSPLDTLQKLTRLAEISLKIEGIDSRQARSFAQLGGDSLAAVGFSLAIEDVFKVSLPADGILDPTASLSSWAASIDQALNATSQRPSFVSVHGPHAREIAEIKADDLQLSKFIEPAVLQAASTLAASEGSVKTVLVTGANGFLGRFVCLSWLTKLAPIDGKVICLIRAKDNASAKQRLYQAFTGHDPEFQASFTALADKHLTVIAGDVAAENLGLSAESYQALASNVDRISHVAALVNHRFGYEHLFGPNVVGTSELISLALTQKLKSIDFVSTEAVQMCLDTRQGNNEHAPLLMSIPLSDAYASGYAASKWASEHLLNQANSLYEVPINIFRGDMMLAHQKYLGEINSSDMFTRILYSVIETGITPYSFYKLSADGSRQQAHYDGTPVNVVAEVVTAMNKQFDGCNVYNITNFHSQDNCSLDTFVDWIEENGHPITRIDNHQEWFERFSDKLNTLPDVQKKQSALEILSAFKEPLAPIRAGLGSEHYQALADKQSIVIPHIDKQFIEKCLSDLRAKKLL
ncbi:MAG: fatty acid CoA ligase FadD9 [Cryomorphaceae bacterium]|jgi:fatty acid CoA ligase FadD9